MALEATRLAIERDQDNSYLPFVRQNELRRAATAHISRMSGVSYHALSQCIITAAGLNGCLVTLLAVLNSGNEVILTDPTYVGMINRVKLAGGVPVLVPFHGNGVEWRLDLCALRNAVTSRSKALFLMSSSMPSGAVLHQDDWDAVAEICTGADIWLIYYATMKRILYDGRARIHHDWLEGRGPWLVLMGYIDDATNRVYARFYDRERTLPGMDEFKRYVQKYGIACSIYLTNIRFTKVTRS